MDGAFHFFSVHCQSLMETLGVLLLMLACGNWPGTQVQHLAGRCQDGVVALCMVHNRRSDGDVGVPPFAFLP